jgi:Na+-driven multidrug efflux pump
MHKQSSSLTFIHSLGPTALAAQSILLLSSTCTFQAPFALSLATSVRYVVSHPTDVSADVQ